MNSRERVIAAIEHQQTTKVPFDMGSKPSSGILAIAYYNLVQHIGKNNLDTKMKAVKI